MPGCDIKKAASSVAKAYRCLPHRLCQVRWWLPCYQWQASSTSIAGQGAGPPQPGRLRKKIKTSHILPKNRSAPNIGALLLITFQLIID